MVISSHDKFKAHFPEIKEKLGKEKADLVKISLSDKILPISFPKDEIEKRLENLSKNFPLKIDLEFVEEIIEGEEKERMKEIIIEGSLASPKEALDFMEFYEEKVGSLLDTKTEFRIWKDEKKIELRIHHHDFYWLD